MTITIDGGLLWCAIFAAGGYCIGRFYRVVPPLFGMHYNPVRGWLYALLVGIYIFAQYYLRLGESWYFYHEGLREGIWTLPWGIIAAYLVGVGYSGRLWMMPPARVREWHAGSRDTDNEVERRHRRRDDT